MKCAYAFATPYGVSGESGVSLVLRRLDGLAEDLRRRRLVEADRRIDLADRLEQRRRADGGELRGQHRLLPRHRHERDGREVVDLVRPERAQRANERELVVHVGLDELEAVAHVREVRVARRAAAHDAENVVAVVEQELGEQRAVLPADAGDERAAFRHRADDRCVTGGARGRSATPRRARAAAGAQATRRTARGRRPQPRSRPRRALRRRTTRT